MSAVFLCFPSHFIKFIKRLHGNQLQCKTVFAHFRSASNEPSVTIANSWTRVDANRQETKPTQIIQKRNNNKK